MINKSKYYLELRDYIDTVPVINTHEHHGGVEAPVVPFIRQMAGYLWSDLVNADFDNRKTAKDAFNGSSMSEQERFELFEKMYNKSYHTSYARAFRLGMKACWNIDRIDAKTMRELQERISNEAPGRYRAWADQFGMKAIVADLFFESKEIIEGSVERVADITKLAFALPQLHKLHTKNDLRRLEEYTAHGVTCLEDYLQSVENYLRRAIDYGIVCFKDQSAYSRSLDYRFPARSEAEKIFNKMLYHPREVIGSEDSLILDDWLFHQFMRLAAKYNLPVQLHTGHMANLENEITKTNAAKFIPVMELHSDVKFDLFHGNWPYMGEYLFIGKNYPNAFLNLCWVQAIDPLYSIELMKRLIMTVPHGKIFAYGGDARVMEMSIGYLIMARDNLAYALCDMIEHGWLGLSEAKRLAWDWFFNNPNEFYRLGLQGNGNSAE